MFLLRKETLVSIVQVSDLKYQSVLLNKDI